MVRSLQRGWVRCAVSLVMLAVAAVAAAPVNAGWSEDVALPSGETAVPLFNGRNLDGWEGQIEKYFSVVDGMIRAANTEPVPTSTYLFTRGNFRNFRLLFEVKQTRSDQHSTRHSAIAALGHKYTDQGDAFGFRGPLLMFCNDWGVWDVHRRNRVFPTGQQGVWLWDGEKVGDWNQIEILVVGNRIRMVANGRLVMDFEDDPTMLEESPIGLQLHSDQGRQEYHFRGLVLVNNPTDRLLTLRDAGTAVAE